MLIDGFVVMIFLAIIPLDYSCKGILKGYFLTGGRVRFGLDIECLG